MTDVEVAADFDGLTVLAGQRVKVNADFIPNDELSSDAVTI